MPRVKFQTLTEQMFYILLCLKEECYGMDIMDKVPAMTNGRVVVGSGTLYNLLEQFMEAGMIRETKAEGRKRSYILTEKGKELTAQISRRASEMIELAGQGISEEMRENMYQCLDSIALRMREISES